MLLVLVYVSHVHHQKSTQNFNCMRSMNMMKDVHKKKNKNAVELVSSWKWFENHLNDRKIVRKWLFGEYVKTKGKKPLVLLVKYFQVRASRSSVESRKKENCPSVNIHFVSIIIHFEMFICVIYSLHIYYFVGYFLAGIEKLWSVSNSLSLFVIAETLYINVFSCFRFPLSVVPND